MTHLFAPCDEVKKRKIIEKSKAVVLRGIYLFIYLFLLVCSETRCAAVQRAGVCHRGNINGAAMFGERGLPGPSVPLVPQQRGASSRSKNQPEIRQLLLHYQPGHWKLGKKAQRNCKNSLFLN